jgi:hypothetical protein
MQGRKKKDGEEEMTERTVTLPIELSHPFFFLEDNITWIPQHENSLNVETPFIYEAAFFSGINMLKPWDCLDKSIPALLKEWAAVKEDIRLLFEQRNNKATLIPMKKGISLLVEFLHWSNGQPSKLSPTINYDNLKIKPVNIQERLEFIIARPTLFHSFMQVGELIVELEKSYNKAVAIRKMRNRG